MLHTLSIYRRLIGVQLRSQMQYRFAFLMDALAAGFVTLLEFASLALVFERFGNIKGWTLGEVAFLYGLVEFSFGLMDMIFSGFDPQRFGREIRRGTFDQMLLRPVNITAQVLGMEFVLRRIGRIALGAAIFSLALSQTDIIWTITNILYLHFVIQSMVCFFGGLFIICATITFWTIESNEVMNILTYGGSFLISHPMHIYGDWMRRFFTFVVPAIFLNYYPALYYLDKPDPFNFPAFAPFLSPFVGLMVLGAALAFWRFGRKHYQSTGS
jgi:ABC-2 type transport system permease protein